MLAACVTAHLCVVLTSAHLSANGLERIGTVMASVNM